MLTTIEKVIFLKEVLFFKGMTIDQLRVLAGISEEATFAEDQNIITEGERGDAIHIIINGRVSIQRRTKGRRDWQITRLAELGPREYFAEMSVFDKQPHSADAFALEETSLLMVRQAPLMALIQQQPDLALDLLKVLSIRLRNANEMIAQKSKTRSKRLMDFFDAYEDEEAEAEEGAEEKESPEEEDAPEKPRSRRPRKDVFDIFDDD